MRKYNLDPSLLNRLYNFKFASARDKLTGNEPKEVQDLVEALSVMFSNCGGLGSAAMQVIVHHALDNLGVWDDD